MSVEIYTIPGDFGRLSRHGTVRVVLHSDYEALESRHRALVEALEKLSTGERSLGPVGNAMRNIARKALQEDNK